MITYELMLLLRVMPKPELKTALKRTAQNLFDRGGIIRKLENLGTRNMPYKTSVHGVVYNRASYFLFEFNAPPSAIEDILEEYGRDVDIIRRRIYKRLDHEKIDCTLDDEILPPPYRKDVQDLIAQAKQLEDRKKKFNFGVGLQDYLFQK